MTLIAGCRAGRLYRRIDSLGAGVRVDYQDARAAAVLRPGLSTSSPRYSPGSPWVIPAIPSNFCGPLVSAKQRDRVLGCIDGAREQGGA